MREPITTQPIETYFERIITIIVDYSPRLISAFLILFIGLYIIRFVNRLVRKIMVKRNYDPTLSQFLADILLWTMRILLFVSFISKLGVESTSFVAILGAMGLAIGLALQGSLSNFAGGVLIILFKPFKIGDFIEAQSVSGEVKEIEILYTKLRSTNNQTIFVPNGVLSNGTITNYSMEDIRRGDLKISVSYDTDLRQAKDIIFNILVNNPMVLKTPAPAVTVVEMNDSGIILAVRPWADRGDFWTMLSDVLQDCKTEFDKQGIELQPFVKELSKKTVVKESK